MNGEPNTSTNKSGISGLPQPWAIAVQLVGTFGLAVFLVLYYVLVMRPQENARYEALRGSVDSLIEVVEKGHSLITREQGIRLESLFIEAVSHEIADQIQEAFEKNISVNQLQKQLEDVMIVRTNFLVGLTRKDGGTLSEMLTHKIRNSEIANEIAQRAKNEWKNARRAEIVQECKKQLEFTFQMAAMGK